MNPRAIAPVLACATALVAAPAYAAQPVAFPESARPYLYFESFDEVSNPAKFTHELPGGWSQDVQGVTSGEARWNGWTVSTIREWTWTAGTDQRHYFTQAHDQIAIIDSQQQRLAPRDSMTAAMVSAPVDVAGREKVAVEFDHHYKQGKKGQSAQVRIRFDGGQWRELARFTANRLTQHEYFEVSVPAGASEMEIEFRYAGGNNDYWWAVDNVAVREVFAELEGDPYAIIDVISDTQGDPEDYKLAVQFLNSRPDPAGALVINGDIVDTGRQAEWDQFLKARSEVSHKSGVEFWTIGNHELYGQELDFKVKNDRYYKYAGEITGQDKPWFEKVVDGVPLIGISTEYYQDSDRDGKEPFQRISREQLEWLDSRLAHWESQGVTALVFTHPLLPQTVSMSHSAWYQNDFEDLGALLDVLSKYNDVVMFTSHSHASLYQPNWWGTLRYDGTAEGAIGFPVVNTGAILNEYMPDGDHDEEIVDPRAASGLRVFLYDDRVRVEAWDFKKGHGLTNLKPGTPTLIKYQDFSKQRRVVAPSPSVPTPTPTTVTSAVPTTVTTAVPTTVTSTVVTEVPTTVPTTVTTTAGSVTSTVTTAVPTTVTSAVVTEIPTTVTTTVTAEVPETVGSSTGEKVGLALGILAGMVALIGAGAFIAPQFGLALPAQLPFALPEQLPFGL